MLRRGPQSYLAIAEGRNQRFIRFRYERDRREESAEEKVVRKEKEEGYGAKGRHTSESYQRHNRAVHSSKARLAWRPRMRYRQVQSEPGLHPRHNL